MDQVKSELSDEYHAVLAQKPTLKYAIGHFNSRHGDSWGPFIPVKDIARVAYIGGFRTEDDLVWAIATALAESGVRGKDGSIIGAAPFVVGDYNINYEGDKSIGLWQMYESPARGWTGGMRDPEANLDPVHNARSALALRDKLGPDAWSSHKHGNNKKFYDIARKAAVDAGLIEK